MRAAVTLDPDLERLIRDAMKQGDPSFKEAARTGLSGKEPQRGKKFARERLDNGRSAGVPTGQSAGCRAEDKI